MLKFPSLFSTGKISRHQHRVYCAAMSLFTRASKARNFEQSTQPLRRSKSVPQSPAAQSRANLCPNLAYTRPSCDARGLPAPSAVEEPFDINLCLQSLLYHCEFVRAMLHAPEPAEYVGPRKQDPLLKLASVLGLVAEHIREFLTLPTWGSLELKSEQFEGRDGYSSPIVSVSDQGRHDENAKAYWQEPKIEVQREVNPDTDSESESATVSSASSASLTPPDAIYKQHSSSTQKRARKRLIDVNASGEKVSWDSDVDDQNNFEVRKEQPRKRLKTKPKIRARKHWSPEETQVFIDLLNTYGRGEWIRMVKTNRLQRDNVQLKDKWRSMIQGGRLGFSETRGFFEFDAAKDPAKYMVQE
eukprot:Gregarina_sp_Poly_1__6827@NODE_369_length_9158_cov_93_280497_g305_i0_p4_GENE_NODE_369_length_9158_cov_93_280497_g305_i0NODE_369_length_9158_cov_93_280497_g305_i0_p4_ORF_typecomplete_len358_score41_43Myb_DNAbinding/PF00249_31/1e04Myb_DNAbinding/PF00249_31/3_3e06Myb_DNAbind_6/PF13921_6/0_11_NODE_369_length_9158_cov_93_280497_g305_i0141087